MAEPRSEYTGKEMGNGAAQVPQNRFLIKIFCQKRAEMISSEKREKKKTLWKTLFSFSKLGEM